MKINFKKLTTEVELPTYANEGDAGLDLVATNMKNLTNYYEYGTSLAVEIPEGYVGLIYPRSSISNRGMSLCNSVGVIDSSYRGEIKLRFTKANGGLSYYELGEKIGQLVIMPYPTIQPVAVDELSSTVRGEGGFGSSDGKKQSSNKKRRSTKAKKTDSSPDNTTQGQEQVQQESEAQEGI